MCAQASCRTTWGTSDQKMFLSRNGHACLITLLTDTATSRGAENLHSEISFQVLVYHYFKTIYIQPVQDERQVIKSMLGCVVYLCRQYGHCNLNHVGAAHIWLLRFTPTLRWVTRVGWSGPTTPGVLGETSLRSLGKRNGPEVACAIEKDVVQLEIPVRRCE